MAVSIERLKLQFGLEPLFADLNLQINRGEFVAVIGPNGSGKTSLVKLLLGLYKPTSGHVHLYENRVGYVPQYLSKDEFSPMTVRELLSLKMPKASFWFNRNRQEPQMREALRRTNVEQVLDTNIRYLSGGEFQRVMIAYALVGNPGLLILDEPVSGIDMHGEHEFFEMIEAIHAKGNITILMISHDIDIVYRYATQVICLNRKLVCQGVPSDVLTKEAIEKTFGVKHGLYRHQHDDSHHQD
jgi:zinc transport system ATP-binding protein